MGRITKEQKLESIEEQIKKLQQKKKDIEKKMKFNLGKTLVEEWEIEDEETAVYVIKELKNQAIELVNKKSELVATNSGASNE